MRIATTDRGDIVHFAGFHHLSPGLDGGAGPAFSAEPGDGVTRCGWEAFFKAMGARDLVLEHDPEDAASAHFVPANEAQGSDLSGAGHGGIGSAIEDSKRFWRALFPPPTPGS